MVKQNEEKEAPWAGTLFNMGVMVRDKTYVGHIVREADDVIIVFPDAREMGERWDVPKTYVKVVGKNVFLDMDLKDLNKYHTSKDSPMPPSIRTDPHHPDR